MCIRDRAYVSDYTFTENDQEIGLTFFEFEIQNNGDEELVADMLSRTFGLSADGEAYAGISIRGPRFIYRQFGEEGGTFDDQMCIRDSISEMCAKVVTNGNGYAILKGKRGGVSRCGGDTAARRANILLSPAQKKDSAAERCRNKG